MAEKTEALTTPATTAVARPSFMTGTGAGKDHLTKEDLLIPRLALGQGLTPQVAEQKEGFAVGVLFNSVTEKLYGKGPIQFCILRADKPRFIQFRPREEGGGVVDMNVPANDPRTQFGANGEKPVATKFYDFLVMVLPLEDSNNPMDNVMALSFKSTGLKVAKRLNSLLSMREGDLYEAVYTVSTGIEKNQKGIYAVYKVENAGWIGDEPTYLAAKKLFALLADKEVAVHRDETGADEEIDDSMAANPETSNEPMPADM
jgi:hypothetical protein